jgi:multiple sugar transport system substrate-binding protein
MKLRPFELVLVIIFAGLIMMALFLLATHEPSKSSGGELAPVVGNVDIWGTLPAAGVETLLAELRKENDSYISVRYQYFPQFDFNEVLVNALADGEGPDLILTSQEKLVEMRKRIKPVSYDSFPVRDVRNQYVDGAQIFALSDGLYSYPIAVDPLMMYWNKDIMKNAGFLTAPKTWETFVNQMFPALIKRDFNREIQQSVVAMGEYGNVRNAFGILSALLYQSGSEAVKEDGNDRYLVRLRAATSGGGDPLEAAVDFYTRFSKPSNALYSWNRSFEEDRSEFTSGEMVFYFGYASEALLLERLNPNLNFDIAEIPQGASATTRRTYGKFYGLSLLESSDNQVSASNVMLSLAGSINAEKIALASGMVPVHRSVVAAGSNDVYGRITYGSATIAQGWLNPNIEAADRILETMTKDINENRRSLSEATADASERIASEY